MTNGTRGPSRARSRPAASGSPGSRLGSPRIPASGPPLARLPLAGLALAGMLLAALAAAGPARAQSPEELVGRGAEAGADATLLAELRARATAAGLDGEAVAALLAPPVALAEAGLPSEMVLQKALEGLAKGVPADRVAEVLARLRQATERAGRLADPWLARADARASLRTDLAEPGGGGRPGRDVLIESTGAALFRGAPEPAVRALLERLPGALEGRTVTALELGVGVEVLPELPIAAREPDVAAALVVEAMGSGFGAAELRELPAALQAAERRGQLPAEVVARGAIVQMRGDIPAVTVLQNLFNAEFPGNVPFDLPPGIEKVRERGQGPPP